MASTSDFEAEISAAMDKGAARAVDGFKPRLDANTRLNPAAIGAQVDGLTGTRVNPVGAPAATTLTEDFNKLIARHEQTIAWLKAIRDTL